MKIKFTKDLLPKHATKENLLSSFPQMFLFVKEIDGSVEICGQESLTSSLSLIPEGKVYSDTFGSRLRTDFIEKEAKKSIENGATHLVTGFYDLINDVWNQDSIFELKNINSDFIKNVFDVSLTSMNNAMFSNEELFKENLALISQKITFTNQDPRLQNFKLDEIYQIMKEYYSEFFETHEKIEDNVIPYKGFVDRVFEHYNVEKDPALKFIFIMTIRGYDLGDVVFYNKSTKEFDYFDGRLGLIDMQEVFKLGSELADQVYPVGIYSQRFLSVQ